MDSLLAEILDDTSRYLRYLKEIGCKGIGAGKRDRETADRWGKKEAAAEKSLPSIQNSIKQCRRCRLADERKAVVFGHGHPGARIMFIGPFPEAEDAESGIPYSGEAGGLLTRIIEAIGERRESVYICHAVKCRPLSDRLPDRAEARACKIWLQQQVKAICPEIICVLGGFATQSLLGTDKPLSRLRGMFLEYEGISVMPTHEPSYLLLHPEAKREAWQDMKKVMARMNE